MLRQRYGREAPIVSSVRVVRGHDEEKQVDPLKVFFYQKLFTGNTIRTPQALRGNTNEDLRFQTSLGSEGNTLQEWAEASRRLRQAEGSKGYMLWVQARQTRLEQEREKARVAAEEASKAPSRCSSLPCLQPTRCWWRVAPSRPTTTIFEEVLHTGGPAQGGDEHRIVLAPHNDSRGLEAERRACRRLDKAVQAVRANTLAKAYCWRADFVEEALRVARAEGMREATITYTDSLATQLAVMGYTEATSSSGARELWSPGFLSLLEALRVRWGLTGAQGVRIGEEELCQRRPDLSFLASPKGSTAGRGGADLQATLLPSRSGTSSFAQHPDPRERWAEEGEEEEEEEEEPREVQSATSHDDWRVARQAADMAVLSESLGSETRSVYSAAHAPRMREDSW